MTFIFIATSGSVVGSEENDFFIFGTLRDVAWYFFVADALGDIATGEGVDCGIFNLPNGVADDGNDGRTDDFFFSRNQTWQQGSTCT